MYAQSRDAQISEMANFRLPKKYVAILQKHYPDVQITEVVNLQVPAQYLELIQQVLEYLQAKPSKPLPSTTESRLRFFLESDPQFWPKHNFVPYFSKKLILSPEPPLYVAENERFQLTREDIEVILSYPFVLTRDVLYLTLQRLGVLSCKGKHLPKGVVYKWKFIEPFYWENRFNHLVATYFPQYNQGRRSKFVVEFVTCRLLAGGYDQQLEQMKKQIEKLHEGGISKPNNHTAVLDPALEAILEPIGF